MWGWGGGGGGDGGGEGGMGEGEFCGYITVQASLRPRTLEWEVHNSKTKMSFFMQYSGKLEFEI